jgi:hypothetical protein
MTNITWTKIVVGNNKPSYKVNYGKFTAEIKDQMSCFYIKINNINHGGHFQENYYASSATACKNYFRKFLKKWGAL